MDTAGAALGQGSDGFEQQPSHVPVGSDCAKLATMALAFLSPLLLMYFGRPSLSQQHSIWFKICCGLTSLLVGGVALVPGRYKSFFVHSALLWGGAALCVASYGWSFGFWSWLVVLTLETCLQIKWADVSLSNGTRSHIAVRLAGSVLAYSVVAARSDDSKCLRIKMFFTVLVGGSPFVRQEHLQTLNQKWTALWAVLGTPLESYDDECSSSFPDQSNSASGALRSEAGIDASPFDDVTIQHQIGHGAFGTVYYATMSGRPVAVKLIQWKSTTYKRVTSPIDEAELSSSLAHPNLVKTIKFEYIDLRTSQAQTGAYEFECWMVQEWCDRGPLAKHCHTPRFFEPLLPEAIGILVDVACGGAYLHSQSVVHGDLTGNNVLLTSSSSEKGYDCKICDFGLSRMLEGNQTELFTTQLGTVSHMPPELFQADKSQIVLTKKMDIYSLGMLIYSVLMGKLPWEGITVPQVVVRVGMGKRLELDAQVPEELQSIFDACTARQSEDRPTFVELHEQLTELLAVGVRAVSDN